MYEMHEDDYLMMAYIDNYPGDNEFEEIPWNPADELANAKPVKEALEMFGISNKDLYYAFLKEEIKDSEPEDFAGWALADRNIILHLWESGIEYSRIPKILMYSPIHQMPEAIKLSNQHTLHERWEACASRVTIIINPVLDHPMMIGAKLPCQLDLLKSSKQEIYVSYLKNVFNANPGMTLREADKKVVSKLLGSGLLSESMVYDCIGCSLQFTRKLAENDKDSIIESSRIAKMKKAFWEETMKELSEQKNKPDVTETTVPSDENNDIRLWNDMLEKIKKFRESSDAGKSIEVWQNIMDVLRETVVHMEQLKYQAQLLILWDEALGRMADELNLEHLADEKEIKNSLWQIIEQNKFGSENLNQVCDILVRLSEYTESFLKEAFERNSNPLIAVAELQNAKPLKEVLSEKKPSAAEVYFALLKDYAEKGISDINTADENIIKRLNGMFVASLSESDRKREISKCLAYSPAFSRVESVERRETASVLVNKVLGMSKTAGAEKNSSR